MRVLVFGNGWLGGRIAEHLNGAIADADILDTEAVASTLAGYKPDVVINAAGKCGSPNIDWCEATNDNKRLTRYCNTFGPPVLYHMAEAVGEKIGVEPFFVHLSSGCLWSHKYDIDETMPPEPPSYYSETKAEGEQRLPHDKALIVRLRMPIDREPHPRNLITKLSNYGFVLDEPNSVTFVDDFLCALKHLVDNRCTGVFNVVNPGPLSAWEIMTLYTEMVDENHVARRIDMDYLWENGMIKAGRSNCTLSVEKLKQAGFEMPDAKAKIGECMREYAKRLQDRKD